MIPRLYKGRLNKRRYKKLRTYIERDQSGNLLVDGQVYFDCEGSPQRILKSVEEWVDRGRYRYVKVRGAVSTEGSYFCGCGVITKGTPEQVTDRCRKLALQNYAQYAQLLGRSVLVVGPALLEPDAFLTEKAVQELRTLIEAVPELKQFLTRYCDRIEQQGLMSVYDQEGVCLLEYNPAQWSIWIQLDPTECQANNLKWTFRYRQLNGLGPVKLPSDAVGMERLLGRVTNLSSKGDRK